MSNGSATIPLLKAAPEPDQLEDRLAGGPWGGLELCLGGAHLADEQRLRRAIEVCREHLAGRDLAVTAEAPVSWPSGAFVRVDRLDEEARSGIRRSAEFARGIGSPVLTIHPFVPLGPEEFRAAGPLDEAAVEEFFAFYARTCAERGVKPLIENVPPVLRMRTGGVFLSQTGGHWRDLLEWRERIPELGFTIDTSHAALFRNFAAAYPSLLGLLPGEPLELDRYIEELGPAAEVAHVSNAHGLLGEGLPYGSGELDLDPVVHRLGQLVPYMVAEINEPDPGRSPDMKRAYAEIRRALGEAPAPSRQAAPPRPTEEPFDWQRVVGLRDPVPSLLELQEVFGGRRVMITGGGGSIARALATFLVGFQPDRIVLLDSHEPSLAADRRSRGDDGVTRQVLGDLRDSDRLGNRIGEVRPDVIFHLAAYKHVDWAESFPEEFVATNLQGSWNVLRAAEAANVETVVVASTDKAALAASFYGRTKRFMEQLAAFASEAGGKRIALRFVNVLGSAGSASELFLRQARGGLALTVTDTGMLRYWITMGQAACMAAHATLLAAEGALLATPADPPVLSVGELASRIWVAAGRDGDPRIESLGIRPGETMNEVLTAAGEELGEERHQGIVPIRGDISTSAAAWIAEHLPEDDERSRGERSSVWMEAMRRPGLLEREGAPPG
jgi:nucleoside-diphosphate-sugar epimerase